MSNEQLDPTKLAQRFATEVWEGYGNVTSDKLEQCWEVLFSTFNECIALNQNPEDQGNQKILAVPMPTGTGKSLATRFYASQLKQCGVLIITYFVKEADKTAEGVNSYGENKASAHHSMQINPLTDDDLEHTQVLVITHAQYLLSSTDPERLQKLNNYLGSPRKLVVIDEALDQTDSDKISSIELQTCITKCEQLISIFSTEDPEIASGLFNDLKSIKQLKLVFSNYSEISIPDAGLLVDNVILEETVKTGIDITTFVTKTKSHVDRLKERDASTDSKILLDIVNRFSAVMMGIASGHTIYISSSLGKTYLNSANHIEIPHQCSVILDATANIDHTYKLHSNIIIVPIPSGVRDYSNVTLHVSEESFKVGRGSLTKGTPYELKKALESFISLFELFPDINQSEDIEELLFITHKKVREHWNFHLKGKTTLTEKLAQFFNVTFDHFGNITGKNTYSSFPKMIILGINYMNATHTTNQHISSDAGLSAIKSYPDQVLSEQIDIDRKKLTESSHATELIQAINRIQCRNVIDSRGRCAPTDIFIIKPAEKTLWSNIVSTIKREMPGIQIVEQPLISLSDNLLASSSALKKGAIMGKPRTHDRPFLKLLIEKSEIGFFDNGQIIAGDDIFKELNVKNSKTKKQLKELLESPPNKDHELYDLLSLIHDHQIICTSKRGVGTKFFKKPE